MKKVMFVLVVFVFALMKQTIAQKPAVMSSTKPGWHKIGETTADFKTEKDEIAVLGADKFKSIKLKVTDAPVHISSMVVYYDNGETQEINLTSDFKAGAESRVVDL